jgi:ElaB/YqjD/DUF883 family membrane-anchored ribosome-binding protein
MEARIARLESDVAHLVSDMADVKADLRSLRDKVDAMFINLFERIDGVAKDLNAKLDARFKTVDDRIARLSDSIANIKVWVLASQLTFGAALLAAMARGFGWI